MGCCWLSPASCATCCHPKQWGSLQAPPQGCVSRQRDLLGTGRGQPKSHAIAIPCQVQCCRVCSQLQAGREGTRPGKVQLSELSVLRKQSRTGDTPMLPICSPVSQLHPPPTHTHRSRWWTPHVGMGRSSPCSYSPTSCPSPRRAGPKLYVFCLMEHTHLQSRTETTKLISSLFK